MNMSRNFPKKPKHAVTTVTTPPSGSNDSSDAITTLSSDSNDSSDDDDTSEPDCLFLDSDTPQVDDFIMVTFTKKRKVSLYIGKVVDVDGESDEVQTKFLRRCDMKKSGHIMFMWPQLDDICWHDAEDIILKLPPPMLVGGTSLILLTRHH